MAVPPLPRMHALRQRWITYQLLHALAQCHERGVCHGDIKTENVSRRCGGRAAGLTVQPGSSTRAGGHWGDERALEGWNELSASCEPNAQTSVCMTSPHACAHAGAADLLGLGLPG